MIVNRLQFVTGVIVLLACLFITGVLFGIEALSNYSRAFIFPFFVCLYFLDSDKKNNFFAAFLIAFSTAELIKVFWDFDYSLFSKVSNIAYIIAYLSLIIYIIQGFNLKRLIGKFKIHISILLLFNGYIIFVLNQMILADKTIEVFTFNFLIECLYNVCILLLLSFSLVNYLYHDSKKDLLLFLASVCIVFSEMVQVAYIFMSEQYILNVIYSVLMATGFYFMYIYMVSKMNKYYHIVSK